MNRLHGKRKKYIWAAAFFAVMFCLNSFTFMKRSVFASEGEDPSMFAETEEEGSEEMVPVTDQSSSPIEEQVSITDIEEGVPSDPVSEQIVVKAQPDAYGLTLSAPSAILMEASTGTVIYEKKPDEILRPASITKIMTLLLIFDVLEGGKISYGDAVTVSEFAASMGGSQVFLEPGEVQSVDTMIKCIAVSSANDACVAMAEHIYGTEEEFVRQMNKRAKGLGMNNTTFVNCNGLDAEGHVTTARDVAIMSRELINKYPKVHEYSQIWMDTITHTTAKGTSEFGLTNTNKLIKQYPYATGLKTGSTSLAKFCVSATAKKDDLELIAVIMASPDGNSRVADATNLLNYGFANCTIYRDNQPVELPMIKVQNGVVPEVEAKYNSIFTYVGTQGEDFSKVEKTISILEPILAPIEEGQKLGTLNYHLGGKNLGSIDIVAAKEVEAAKYKDYLKTIFKAWIM